MNVNTVQLKVVEKLHYGVFTTQVDPTEYGRSRADYRDWLTRGPGRDRLPAPPRGRDRQRVHPAAARRATCVRRPGRSGFRPGDSVGLPDGRTVTVWERSGDGC